MPPEKLRTILRPRYAHLAKSKDIEAITLVSYIQDFLLSEADIDTIKEWILANIQNEQMRELLYGKE